MLSHEDHTKSVVLSVVGLTAYGKGAKLTVQSSPCGTITTDDGDMGWTAVLWEDGTPLVFTKDDSAELPSLLHYIRVLSDTDFGTDADKILLFLK